VPAPEIKLVSQHDFGVEETASFLKAYVPDYKSFHVVGINVLSTQNFVDSLSDELIQKIDEIKEKVIEQIKFIGDN